MRSNYLLTLLKLILFLAIFCFLATVSREFFREIKQENTLELNVLYLAVFSPFAFYVFIADLNNLYAKIQRFFFRSSFLPFLFPALIIFLGVGLFLLPKVLNFSFDKNAFLFLGGFIVSAHLIFVAREMKGTNFASFVNYLFIFSLLYIVNLLLFALYLKVAFKVDLGRIITAGSRSGAFLIKGIFSQLFK